MGARAVSMILFTSQTIGLDDVARALSASGLAVERKDEGLGVDWNGGPVLEIRLSRAEWVLDEAVEIGEGTPYAADLARCDARIEISIPDLDEALDEANTLIQAQGALQDLTRGFVFNSWNGGLQPPES